MVFYLFKFNLKLTGLVVRFKTNGHLKIKNAKTKKSLFLFKYRKSYTNRVQ